uniref:Putative metabotropic gamma-aminobutyric acid receptor n=1 Tax=Ixodes ricinus TaxID=34613 RepID=V5GXC5_IXORI
MCAVAFIGVVWAVGLLVFNWIFRHSRYIQLSHPMCNNIMLIGIILCLVCVCLLGLDGQFVSEFRYAHICQVSYTTGNALERSLHGFIWHG